MQNSVRCSKLELRGSRNDLRAGSEFHPTRPRPGGPASFCTLNPMVATRRAGGRAGSASRGGPEGRSPPRKAQCARQSAIPRAPNS
eukprot:13427544-Alexandrium_andersonii.AAC.1